MARCSWRGDVIPFGGTRECRPLQSCHGHLVSNRQPEDRAIRPYGNSPANGMVLVAGGNPGDLDSAELYDPATGTWSATGSLNDGRADDVETLLPNGMVLMAGGTNLGSLDAGKLYNPATDLVLTVASTPCERTMPQLSCSTAWCSSQGEHLPTKLLSRPRNSMIRESWCSGRGSIDGQGDEATFKFDAKQSDNRPTGSLSFSDHAAGISITKTKIRTLTFNGNSADLGGTARLGEGKESHLQRHRNR